MKGQFKAKYLHATKKDGTQFEFLSIGVVDEKGEYTELRKEFLNPLEKKMAVLCGIDLNVDTE